MYRYSLRSTHRQVSCILSHRRPPFMQRYIQGLSLPLIPRFLYFHTVPSFFPPPFQAYIVGLSFCEAFPNDLLGGTPTTTFFPARLAFYSYVLPCNHCCLGLHRLCAFSVRAPSHYLSTSVASILELLSMLVCFLQAAPLACQLHVGPRMGCFFRCSITLRTSDVE